MEYFDDIQLINGARILDESGNPVWNGDGIFIPSFASDPSTPSENQVYWNTTNKALYRYNGASWDRLSIYRDNLSATVPPTVNNDATQGYEVNSRWVDTTAERVYICVDNTTGSAVWVLISQKEVAILTLTSTQNVNVLSGINLNFSTITKDDIGISVSSGAVTLPVGVYRASYNFSYTGDNGRKNIISNLIRTIGGNPTTITGSLASSYTRNNSNNLGSNNCSRVEEIDFSSGSGQLTVNAARNGDAGTATTLLTSALLIIEKIR